MFFSVLLGSRTLHAQKFEVEMKSEAVVLINGETGAVLYEKNAHIPHYPASITKVATTLFALKTHEKDLSTIVTAEQDSIASISSEAKKRSNYTMPSYWIEQASTHMGIKKGEEFTLKDLLFGVMVVSANDASNVVAQHCGIGIQVFVNDLNEYLKTIGCLNTHFKNPHGLHHPKHQTTPYDMAIITKEAMKIPLFRELAKAPRYVRPKTNKQEPTVMLQKNRLLRAGKFHYPKAIGVKTGYTSVARHTLIAAAKDENRTLIAVLMKGEEASDVYEDAIKLFDLAFDEKMVKKSVLQAGPQKFVSEVEGGHQLLTTYIKEPLIITFYPSEEPKLKCYLQWNELKLPIKKDEQVGFLHLKNSAGETLNSLPLFSEVDVDKTWTKWLSDLF